MWQCQGSGFRLRLPLAPRAAQARSDLGPLDLFHYSYGGAVAAQWHRAPRNDLPRVFATRCKTNHRLRRRARARVAAAAVQKLQKPSLTAAGQGQGAPPGLKELDIAMYL
jgi:hypothetical protein